MSRSEFEAALEAILFVAADPVSSERLLSVFDDGERAEAGAALEALRERYRAEEGRGVFLEEVAGGLRLVTVPACHPYLRKFFEATGGNRLSMAALETLAIVAYRQPVTGPEIQELRGKSPVAALKTLLEKRMIRIAGRKEVVGRPFLYATTREFLMHFGLASIKDLPPLEEFEDAFGLAPEAEGDGAISGEHEAIGLVSTSEAEQLLGVDEAFEVRAPGLESGEPAAEDPPSESKDEGSDSTPGGFSVSDDEAVRR